MYGINIEIKDCIASVLCDVQYTSHYCEENIYLLAKKYFDLCQANDKLKQTTDAYVSSHLMTFIAISI